MPKDEYTHRRKPSLRAWFTVDLRKVTWRTDKLARVVKMAEIDLRPGEAILCSNEKEDRFRIVECVSTGFYVLVIPPFDPDNKTSIYLKISSFLTDYYTPVKKVQKAIDEEITTFQAEPEDG